MGEGSREHLLAPTEVPPGAGCERILIADDNDVFRQLLMLRLSRCGYEVIEAEDGRAAVAHMRRQRPDLVLCDLRMPHLDGLGVLKAAREEHAGLPVIVMSGAGLLEDAVSALKLGATDYLMKPISEDAVLEHSVRRALEDAALRRENERYRVSLERAYDELATSLRLLREDEEAGRQIQFRLLPARHHRIRGYEFSYSLHPSTHVSGDFLDVFPVGERHIGMYLADVAGHGVSSAFVTVYLKSFVHHLVEQYDDRGLETVLSPAQTLTRLNEEMLREQIGKHLTAFYGVIDTEANQLLYASAGQLPCPILYDGSDSNILDAKGYPVGLFEFAQYEEQRCKLPEHLVLAVCSDGVLEIVDASDLAAKTRWLQQTVCDFSIDVDAIFGRMNLPEHSPLPDDATILLVKRGEDRDGNGQSAVG